MKVFLERKIKMRQDLRIPNAVRPVDPREVSVTSRPPLFEDWKVHTIDGLLSRTAVFLTLS